MVKNPPANAGELGSISGLRRFPGRRERLPTPLFWPGELYGLYSLQGRKELDMTERLSFSRLSGGASGKEPVCQRRRYERHRFNLWFGEIPQRRALQPTPAFLPGESHGHRSLAGYSP